MHVKKRDIVIMYWEKRLNFFVIITSFVILFSHTHTHLSVYLSIDNKNEAMKIFFFLKKFLKKILVPRINCSDTKYIHLCILETAAVKTNSKRTRWPMRALWLHEIKERFEFHLNWIGCWNFMRVGGPEFVVWNDDDLKIYTTTA